MKYLRHFYTVVFFVFPGSVLAQVTTATLNNPQPSTSDARDFAWLVGEFLGIINLLIPFIFGLALLVFLWGIASAWILGGGDSAGVESGKKIALAGIIGFVVMASLWGLVAFLRSGFFGY